MSRLAQHKGSEHFFRRAAGITIPAHALAPMMYVCPPQAQLNPQAELKAILDDSVAAYY